MSEYAHSNRMVLQEVDASFSFADFDMNGDDEVDFVFIYYWSPKSTAGGGDYRINRGSGGVNWTGISAILPGSLSVDGGARTITSGGGATIVPRAFSGACIGEGGGTTARVRNQWWALATSAHEYFHDIMAQTWPVLGTGSNGHIESAGAYDLMDDNQRGMLLSGVNRFKAGWLDPPELTPGVFSGDTTIVLRNVAKSVDRSSIILRTSDEDQYFFVEARDTTGSVYTSTMPVVGGLASCCQFPGTPPGLLVTHIHEDGRRGWASLPPKPPIFDPEIVSGLFSATGVPDPKAGADTVQANESAGVNGSTSDLLRPGAGFTSTFAPYTNPSSNLYASADSSVQRIYSGWTIYNIAWAGAGTDSIQLSIRYDATAPPNGGADTVRVNTIWDGITQLTGDLAVVPAAKLTVKQNAMVVVSTSDRHAGGQSTGKNEIIIRGKLDVQGGSGNAVTFTSSRDDNFVHFRGPGETSSPAAGNWYGVRLLNGTLSPTANELSYTNFKYGNYAVSVDTSNGNIYECNFASNDSADIYLAKDTTIPDGKEWRLRAPTKVLIKSDVSPDGVDLNVYGNLTTSRPGGGASSDSVVFTTLDKSEETGDDWRGITIWDGATGQIYDASIGYATDPVYFSGSGFARVWNSSIHHYKNTGIVDFASNAWLDSNVLYRDPDASESEDRTAIHTMAAASGRIEDNTINWHERYGILTEFDSSPCNAAVSPETLRVLSNDVTGNSLEDGEGSGGSGIGIVWACGKQFVEVVQNVIDGWADRGLDLQHCGEMEVKCNVLEDNRQGVFSFGNYVGATNKVRLLENILTSSFDTNLYASEASNLKINYPGTGTPTSGRNYFTPDSTGPSQLGFNITMNDSSSTATLNARRNRWRRYDGTGTTDLSFIAGRVNGTYAAYVQADTVLTTDPTVCGQLPTGSFLIPYQVAFDGSEQSSVGAGDMNGIPLTLKLVGCSPNPARERTEIAYEVPRQAGNYLDLSVYNLAGRLVRTLVHGQPVPGKFRASWDGNNCSGDRVTSGIYFVRMQAEGFSQTRKVVYSR